MERTITIQDAVATDAEGIRSVQKQTWLATYPNPKRGISREDVESKIAQMQSGGTQRWAKRLREDTSSHTWVVKDEDVVIGFISAQKLNEENKIRAMYLLPEYQGQGIGKQLMQKALDWLGDTKSISLEVVSYNDNAINFYKKFGFVESGETTSTSAHLPSGKDLPELLMVRIVV